MNDKIQQTIEDILQDIATEALKASKRDEKNRERHEMELYFYFDPLLGRPLEISPRLSKLIGAEDETDDEEVTAALLRNFPLHFPPKLQRGLSAVPFVIGELFEYERLLAGMLDRLEYTLKVDCRPPCATFIKGVVSSIASEIFSILDDCSNPPLHNPLLALLVRCLNHAIRFHRWSYNEAAGRADKAVQREQMESSSTVIGMGLLVAASFLPPSFFYDTYDDESILAPMFTNSASTLEAEQLVPSLAEQFSLVYAVHTYCNSRLHLGTNYCAFWDDPVINLKYNALSVDWAESPVLRRCAVSLVKTCNWDNQFAIALGNRKVESFDKIPQGRTKCGTFSAADFLKLTIVQMCRAHFFGRLFPTNSTEQISTVTQQQTSRHPSGVIVSKSKSSDTDAPSETRRLSQLVAPLRIFSILIYHTFPTSLLVEMLPVIYSLLDFWDSKYQTLGGALYLSLFRHGDQMKGFLLKDDDGLAEQILNRVILTCRDPVAVALLSMAHCKILLIKANSDRPRLLDACKGKIHKAKTTYFGPDTDVDHGRRMLPGLVVGAILPLLSHLATWNAENANAIEISREGLDLFLSTLLGYCPSHGCETTESVRTIAALIGLVTLLMGSWPVARAYSGQIMCSHLTVIGKAERQDTCSQKHSSSMETSEQQRGQRNAVSKCTKHSASIALIICGEAGQQVLTAVENESTTLTQVCKEIRLHSQALSTAVVT
jgi:hypothetical protein